MDNYNENNPTTDSMASQVRSQVAEAAQTAKEKVTATGQQIADRLDETRHSAARNLDQAATTLHETGPKLAGVTNAAAGKLEATAEYLRGHDFGAMVGDVENFVRRYPGESLAVAAAAGFLVARVLRGSAA